jgi:hypothetical protein
MLDDKTKSDGIETQTIEESRRKDSVTLENLQLAKLTEELAAMREARSSLSSWCRSTSQVIGALSLSVGFIAATFGACSAFKSMSVAKDAEARLNRASEAEIDVKIVSAFNTQILPSISGIVTMKMSDPCFEEALKTGADGNTAAAHCTGAMPMGAAPQKAAYWSAVDLAKRYPLLCRSVAAALKNQSNDTFATEALGRLGPCPEPEK